MPEVSKYQNSVFKQSTHLSSQAINS
jgi:hypothetical protein